MLETDDGFKLIQALRVSNLFGLILGESANSEDIEHMVLMGELDYMNENKGSLAITALHSLQLELIKEMKDKAEKG